jgi:hypothetical protein
MLMELKEKIDFCNNRTTRRTTIAETTTTTTATTTTSTATRTKRIDGDFFKNVP